MIGCAAQSRAVNRARTTTIQALGVPALLTTDEVAATPRTSRKAIYAMVARQQLPGIVRVGRRVLVREDALLDWLRQKSTPLLER